MRPLVAALAALVLLLPATAMAGPFEDVFADYRKDGTIDSCAHSEADLRKAKGDIPNDIEQYAPDFPAALEEAMEERARTGCTEDPASGPTDSAPAASAPVGSPPPPEPGAAAQPNTPGQAPTPVGAAQPVAAASDGAIVNAASRSDDRGGDAPAPLIALAIIGGLLALCALVWAVFRFFAWEPRWLLETRHAVAEAGWRASGAWADFTDWVRSRRDSAPS